MKKLTKNNFEQWLRSKSPRTKVGDRSSENNPISRFAKTKGIVVDVMPKWAEQFTTKLQESGNRKSSVCANAALSML